MRSSRRSAATSCVWKPSPKAPLSRDRRAEASCNRVLRAPRLARHLPAVHQRRHRAGGEVRRRPPRRSRVVHRLDGRRPQGRRARRRASRQEPARARRQQRDHRRRVRQPRPRRARRSSSARSAPPVSAAPARAACSCTSRARRSWSSGWLRAYAQVRIGDPLEAGTLMGPLIDAARRRALQQAHRSRAQRAGGTVLCGGKVRRRPGNFVEPTIVRARGDWEIVQTETFAPILYLIEFETLDEAIAMQNAVASRPVVGDLHRQPADTPSASCRRRAATAASPTSTSARRARRSAARSAARRTPAAAASRARTLEGVHAPPDQHDQLEPRAAARAGHRFQSRAVASARADSARASPLARHRASPTPARRSCRSCANSDTRNSSIIHCRRSRSRRAARRYAAARSAVRARASPGATRAISSASRF